MQRPIPSWRRPRRSPARRPLTRSTTIHLALAAALAALGLLPATAPGHKGNPDYLSEVTAVSPRLPGLRISVVNRDDRLLLENRTGRTVVIEGYVGDRYARLGADGSVEVNTNSSAYYLNQDRFGRTNAPRDLDDKAQPRWKRVAGNGRFEWHDHRMHWMGKGRPPQVRDEAVRTKVFDWKVPLRVEGARGAIAGRLLWTPRPDGGMPLGAVVLGVVLVAGLAAVVVVIRRRRRRGGIPSGEGQEAW